MPTAPHLRFAGRPDREQRAAFLEIALADPLLRGALEAARRLDLPDWWVVSGALYNTIWNVLTARPSGHGIRDVDLFYHDAAGLSWEAEDRVIRRAAPAFATLAVPVEIRNQARVHLWSMEKFGRECPVYVDCRHSIRHFASKTHAVALRVDRSGEPELYAPFGLDDIFSFRVTPNHALDNRATHEAKGARAAATWPEVAVIPW